MVAPKDIRTTAIGGDLFSAQDMIFDDESLLSSGVTTSDEFLLPQALGAVQMNIVAGANGCATGVAETIVISVETAATSGGSFTARKVLTIPASTTFAEGERILEFLPPVNLDEVYTKVVITTDYDATGQQVTAYIVEV